MTFDAIIIPSLTFLLGALIGTLWQHTKVVSRVTLLETLIGGTSISTIQTQLSGLQQTILALGIVDLAANVKAMKESIIFRPEFQQQMATICSEHPSMHDQISTNTEKLAVLEHIARVKAPGQP